MKFQGSSRRSLMKQTAVAAAAAAGMGARPAPGEAENPDIEECGSIWERPPKQHGNNLNLIVIVSDTFRRDHLACYGKKWLENLETPNLDRFAKECVVFEDAYPEGMPTALILPASYELHGVIYVTAPAAYPFGYLNQ